MRDLRALVARLVRSAGAGAVAALVDLGALTTLVSLVGLSPRAASVPSLVLGGIVMFFGQKRFAFRSRGGRTGREALLFSLVQIGALVLTAILYEVVMRTVPGAGRFYVVVRLVTTNVVWLAYSFPLWHLVFKTEGEPEPPS